MPIACFIRDPIDPFQRDEFRRYAETWARVIPACGGGLLGDFLPSEGTNDGKLILREERSFLEIVGGMP
jgi:hypothetical protein